MINSNRNGALITFISIIAIFITIGLIFIYSSSSFYALQKMGSAHYYVKKQLFGVMLGLLGLIICRYLPIEFIKKCVPWVFGLSLFLTALTLVPGFGTSIHGSNRWIYIAGFGFQPSKLLKMSFIVYISYLLAKKQFRVTSFINGYLPLLLIVGITSLLLLKQPDFGQTVTLSITAFILFFIAECKTKHVLLTFGALLPAIGILIYMKPYRIQRILTFLDPWNDPQGSGFQVIQSLIAIGSGNITGVGVSQSKQKFFYLPMQHTDFIFSIIAEETGFIGASILIMLYLIFLYAGIKIAYSLKDPFCFYATVGFVLLTSLQAIINLFVATGLMPTKGLGLPFISYGLSALIMNLCMTGLVINFAYNKEKAYASAITA